MIGTLVKAIATAMVCLGPSVAVACAFHLNLPSRPLSQVLADSPTLVAARTTVADPFRFTDLRILKGGAIVDTPPHLVDSETRRKLQADPEAAVLFSREGGAWTRLFFLNDATRPAILHMLAWSDQPVPPSAPVRRDFAADLLQSSDPGLHNLALRELDSLDYGVLRAGHYPVTATQLLHRIDLLQDQAYAPIRILLTGIVGGGEQQFRDRAQSRAGLNTGAWLTASIETGGHQAISEIRDELAEKGPPANRDTIAGIVRALALHRARGAPELRPDLDRALAEIARLSPHAAALLPGTFTALSDWSHGALVQDLLTERAFQDKQSAFAAAAYLSRALADGAPGHKKGTFVSFLDSNRPHKAPGAARSTE